jgi:tetratricopeptide (TPR) repeat protein
MRDAWWDKLVVSLELADLDDPDTRERLDSVAAKVNSQGVQTAAAWRYARARPMLTAAIEIWARLGRGPGEVAARNVRGSVYRRLGDHAAAADDHRTAIGVAQEWNLPGGEITARACLGAVCMEQGDLKGAAALLDEALLLSAQMVDKRGAGQAGHFLGLLHEARKDWEAALAAYGTAVERWRALHAQTEAIESTAGVARVMLAQGQAVAACGLVEEILRHLSEHGPARLDEPLRVYWTAYRALHTMRQQEAADELLAAAHALLERQAEGLDDAERARFFEALAVNRAIGEAWRAVQPPQR